MPNWCTNYATITHNEPQMIIDAIEALNEGKLFEKFVPFPNGEWDYGWCIENWGTKWDANKIDAATLDDTTAYLVFDTAWGPPIDFYEALEQLGFTIDATYHEPGMCFAGHFVDGENNQYDYDFGDPDWAEGIDDEDVLEMLQEEYESHLEMMQEWEE